MNPLTFPNNRAFDVLALGRLAIDLNANETMRPMEETMTFTKYVGGSPANIAIGSARLGLETGFIGRVSDDQMGRFIRQYLENNHIDTSNIVTDDTGAVTGLAFTEIKSPQDCSILMYRDNAVDLTLSPDDVSESYIKQAKSIVISGTALASSPSREAVFVALDFARKHNVVVLLDLDYRPYTWKSTQETAVYYNLAAEKADVIIGTREEFDMMEGLLNEAGTSDQLTAEKWFSYHAEIVLIKHGGEGSYAFLKDGTVHRGGTFQTKVLKTFGAGDSYASALLFALHQGATIQEAMRYGAASASIVISRHSCSDAMPTRDELEEFMKTAVENV